MTPNSPPSRSGSAVASAYSEAVPAVVRALAVLEHLRERQGGATLSQLSRDLGISPSSLLAIARTLCNRGYLQRDEVTGRYRLGPALAGLGAAGSHDLALVRAAEAVVALAQAAIGSRAQERASSGARRQALAALGQAAGYLSDLLRAEHDEPDRHAAASGALWQAGASGPLSPEELDQFLSGDCLATLSCIKDTGYPYSVPVWYQWEGGRFWVVPRARAAWTHYLAFNPRVSLAISEHTPPLRRVLVEGRAEEQTAPGSEERAAELLARMAARYLGPEAPSFLKATASQHRRVFSIISEKLVSWRGLAPHPRYESAQPQAGDSLGVA